LLTKESFGTAADPRSSINTDLLLATSIVSSKVKTRRCACYWTSALSRRTPTTVIRFAAALA